MRRAQGASRPQWAREHKLPASEAVHSKLPWSPYARPLHPTADVRRASDDKWTEREWETLVVECWCQRGTARVSALDVLRGRAGSCWRSACRPPR